MNNLNEEEIKNWGQSKYPVIYAWTGDTETYQVTVPCPG